MPELQTLIDICNAYQISLDAILNGDRNYVKKTSRIQKAFRKSKYIIFYFQVNVDSSISGEISKEDEIAYTEINGLADSVVQNNKPQIEKIVRTMNHYWHTIYD